MALPAREDAPGDFPWPLAPRRMLEWGQSDALFVDQRPVSTGPPPSEARLTRLIRRRVDRLGR